ncbi:TraX protein [compost metagenome]
MPNPAPALTSRPRDVALDLIKWLALLSMLVDHLRHVWPQLYFLYIPGRLAFPLFCLAIAANLLRPQAGERKPLPLRYLGLLLAFALLSEWPYRLLVQAPQSLNIMPTLVLGLLIGNAVQQPHGPQRWLGLGALLLAILGHSWLMFGVPGTLLPAAFVYALSRPSPAWIWPVLLCLLANYWPPFYIDATRGDPFAWAFIGVCVLAPLFGLWLLRQPLAFPVPPVRRWAYLFYPGHFLALAALRELMQRSS